MTTEIARPASTDPLDFLARAQQSGATPEEIDKWLTLHERVTKAQAEKAYNEAMRRCQERMPAILKTHENKQTHSKYPKFENMLAVIKPIYVEEGFALSFGTEDSILPGHYRIVCDVKHVGGHGERYQGDFPADGIGAKGNATAMNSVQAVGSTYTYARRYLTAMIFNLTIAGEDTDAARQQVADAAEEKKAEERLEAIRRAYAAADLTPEEDEKFWAWVDCGSGNFADVPVRKYRDVLLQLTRKAERKQKAGAA